MAESSGLIGPLTDWVVDEACRATADGRTAGARPWVSVNMSSSQLMRPDIVSRIAAELETSGLVPDRLVDRDHRIGAARDRGRRPAVERLSALGVRVAIDDFGTGYSTLSYLARLPIDIVKIDRSFVIALRARGAGGGDRVGDHRPGETARPDDDRRGDRDRGPARRSCASLGCDLGQGFYLGRPGPDEDRRRSPLPSGHRLHLPKLASLGA